MSPAYVAPSQIVCRCLQVSEAELEEAALYNEMNTVREVTLCTGAGGGCMSCHPAIKAFLRRKREMAEA